MTNSEIKRYVTVRYDSTGKRLDGHTDPIAGATEYPVYELNEGTKKTTALYEKKPGGKRTC